VLGTSPYWAIPLHSARLKNAAPNSDKLAPCFHRVHVANDSHLFTDSPSCCPYFAFKATPVKPLTFHTLLLSGAAAFEAPQVNRSLQTFTADFTHGVINGFRVRVTHETSVQDDPEDL